ncbi:hypothetical protein RJ640_026579, partial [Escallonia rubra]
IDKICKVANKPLVVTYTGLIQACLDAGNIESGVYIFNHMHKVCSPNLVTCNILMKAYFEHEMFDEAKELFMRLAENGNRISSKLEYNDRVMPDIYTFNLMLDACVAHQRWDDLESVYEKMLQHGFHFNTKRHLRLILDACRAGKVDQPPPPLLTKEMFRVKLEQDDYAAAFSCIARHPSDDSPVFSPKAWLNFFRENAHRFQKETLVRLINEVIAIHIRHAALERQTSNSAAVTCGLVENWRGRPATTAERRTSGDNDWRSGREERPTAKGQALTATREGDGWPARSENDTESES